jgi:4-amino-4-deoxy-L-arabinose transferase-like glycosyltransferase
MSTPHRAGDPALVLLVALLGAQFALLLTHWRHPLITDELYYVSRARYIAEHRRFAPIVPHSVAVDRGETTGNNEWRPPGYALFVAFVSLGDFSDPAGALRLRVTVVQFAMVAALIIALYRLALRLGVQGRARYAAAILLAAPPWVFAFLNEIGPDPESVALIGFALIALAAYVIEGGLRPLLVGTFLSTIALFFRPEMIVMPPLFVAVAMLLRRRLSWRDAFAAGATFCAIVSLQAAYHTWFTGTPGIIGAQRIVNRGAFDWANTWLGTEKETYEFVYAVTERQLATVPDRAFDSAAERDEVRRIVERVHARNDYAPADDAEFEKLAREKQRQHPIRVTLLRGWHGVHQWLNLETNFQLLNAMTSIPRPIRLPIHGALLLLRIAALALACVATARALRHRSPAGDVVLLFMSYVVARTLLTGVVLNWNVHRYVVSAWPPLLWCAALALRES